MSTIVISTVLAEIDRQLDWRGPSGKGQGHIVLGRDEAAYLRQWCITLCTERDELRHELETKSDKVVAC